MSSAAQQFFAFVMFPDRVAVVLWQRSGEKISILAQSGLIETETAQDKDLSLAIDTALDQMGDVGLGIKGALFVVPSSWVEGGDLSDKKKRFLKNLTHDLILDPLGYVVLTDTLLAHEASKSPKPLSGILVFDSNREWLLEDVRQGLAQPVEFVGKSQDHAADQAELASRLKKLGARPRALLIPLDARTQDNTEETLEATLATAVEIVRPEELVKIAVTVGGAEILDSLPTESTDHDTVASKDAIEEAAVAASVADDDFAPMDFNVAPVTEPEEVAPTPAAPSPTVWDVSPQDTSRVTERSPAGFIIHRSSQDTIEDELPEEGEEYDPEPVAPRAKRSFPKISLPAFKLPSLRGKKNIFVLGLGAVLLLLLAAIGGGYFWLAGSYTATASVWLQPQVVEQEFQFIAGAPNASAAATANAVNLPGEIITENVTLETEVPATGTKITGDPATGTVTLLNKTSQDKTFAAGTRLQGDGKAFEFRDEVTVEAAEEDGDGITFGKVDADVKAVDIGPEGNIAKDVNFTVANFDSSSYQAKSKEAFTGGTKREIQAVSQQDIDRAAQQLKQAAQDEVKKKFAERQNEGNTIFPSGQITVTNTQASPQVDEEAKFVKVSITASSPGLLLTAEQSLEQGRTLLASQVQADQELLPDTVEFQPQNVTVSPDGRSFTISAKVAGQTVLRVMADELSQEIQGAYVARAETILSEKPGVARQEIVIEPSWIRWLFSQLPKDSERIQMNIKLDRNS